MLKYLCKTPLKIKTLIKATFSWNKSHSPSQRVSAKSKKGPSISITGSKNAVEAAGRDLNKTINNYITTEPSDGQPDVALRLTYPKSPALILINQSSSIARDIKWTVALWNMDLPERDDPLPIPVSTFDWIRPHSEGGPQSLFSNPAVASLLKHGNKLFGSISVISPKSIQGRTYIVFINWGIDGWFHEVEDEISGKIIIPSNFLRATRETYFKELEASVPKQSRVTID